MELQIKKLRSHLQYDEKTMLENWKVPPATEIHLLSDI